MCLISYVLSNKRLAVVNQSYTHARARALLLSANRNIKKGGFIKSIDENTNSVAMHIIIDNLC